MYATLEISDNYLENNWSGVALRENADQFCDSPANTGSRYCTGGRAGISDHVRRRDDRHRPLLLRLSLEEPERPCDQQRLPPRPGRHRLHEHDGVLRRAGAVLNWGAYPTWPPYTSRTIQDAITFKQNNRFTNNRYLGDGRFTPYEMGRILTFSSWQGARYGQDGGSTLIG